MLKHEKFISPQGLSEWVEKNGITRDRIQDIVFDSVYKKFILFYWE